MSVYISFKKLHIDQYEILEEGDDRAFQISIKNDNYNEELRFRKKSNNQTEKN